LYLWHGGPALPSEGREREILPLGVSEERKQLSAEQVRKISRLARLELSDAEVESHRGALSVVVGLMDRMRAVDLAGVEPLAHVTDAHTRLDDDVPSPAMANEMLVRLAPESWNRFVRVPKVLDEGGGA
jgi:aspartyl-tRNA(Asn)/glutamyl-tRNA(Gln) amidotransferase subunit C